MVSAVVETSYASLRSGFVVTPTDERQTCASIRRRGSRLTGFTKWPAAPNALPLGRSSLTVKRITGQAYRVSCALSALRTSQPSISGIIISRMIAAGWLLRAIASPSCGSRVVMTRYPSRTRMRCTRSRTAGSSSMISMWSSPPWRATRARSESFAASATTFSPLISAGTRIVNEDPLPGSLSTLISPLSRRLNF